MNFRIFTLPEIKKTGTSSPIVELCPQICSFAALNTSNFKTLIPHQRNLALLWLHFAKNNRRTLFLKTGVPTKMAKFPLTIIIKTFKTKQGFAYRAI